MKTKIVVSIIYLVLGLNLIPNLFKETDYWDNVYYVILYFLLTYLSVVAPYIVEKMDRIHRVTCSCLSVWMFGGFITEVLNFRIPKEVINSFKDDFMYTICVSAIMLVLTIELTYQNLKKDG